MSGNDQTRPAKAVDGRLARQIERQTLQSAIEIYLESCFERRERPTVSEFAKSLDLARPHVSQVLKRVFGKSGREVLQNGQLNRAEKLLRDTSMTVEEIARAAGFGTLMTCELVSELVARNLEDFAKGGLQLAAPGSTSNSIILIQRNRRFAVVPPVRILAKLVASARGTNIHVRVGFGWLWPAVVWTLTGLTAAGIFVSYAWREFLFAPWFGLAALVAAVHHILSVGEDIENLFNASLPE